MEGNRGAASSAGKRSSSVAAVLRLLLVCYLSVLVDCCPCVSVNSRSTRQVTATQDGDVMSHASAALSTDHKATDLRLPTSLRPLHYLVRLQPFVRGNFSIEGYVEVEMEVVTETSIITLHMADIITHNDTVKVVDAANRDGTSLSIVNQTYYNHLEFYQVHLQQPLTRGRRYVLSMEFTGHLNDQLSGFFRSSYTDTNGIQRWIGATQFQPLAARRAFPCFDEPAMKATFEIFLGRETDMTAVSNMPIIDSQPMEGQPGWVWDHFNTSVPMSTYLVAFLVSDFKSTEVVTQNGVSFRVWAREAAINQANYSLKLGSDTLTFFEDYFNIPYPLPKEDMVALPDSPAVAMENWGLITYKETSMLYDPMVSAAVDKQRVAKWVVHELAHMWFGNLVTADWWPEIWLNEGFATFLEYVGINNAQPGWQMMEQFPVLDLQRALRLDCLESSHPINIPVNQPDDINAIFDTITYSKGASIIRMMNFFLTEETFHRGLTNYLNASAYGTAEQDDLYGFLTRAAHQDQTLAKDITVKTIMDTWTLQMGYPVVQVTRGSDGTSAVVTQERFLLRNDSDSSDTHSYKWWVPLTYTTQTAANFTSTAPSKWLSVDDSQATIHSLPDSSQWVIFNIQQTGYYMVNYDDNNWRLLMEQLRADHTAIHVNNRVQLIDDAFNLARAGQLSYSLPMDLIGYLKNETKYTPWSTALDNLNYIDKLFSRTGAYGALKAYIMNLLEPLYQAVGFQESPTDSHLDQYKRVKMLQWACKLGHQDCVTQSITLFKLWMMNPKNKSIISPNLKDVVYCTAIAAGGEKEWEFAWSQYLASNVATEKNKLLIALGCSQSIWVLSRYLEMTFTMESGIRSQDAVVAFKSVALNSVGRDLAWTFLRDQWQHITDHLGSGLIFSLPVLIEDVTDGMDKELHLRELKHFQSANKDNLGTAERVVSQAIERTQHNMEWMNKNRKLITQYLESNGYSSKLRSE